MLLQHLQLLQLQVLQLQRAQLSPRPVATQSCTCCTVPGRPGRCQAILTGSCGGLSHAVPCCAAGRRARGFEPVHLVVVGLVGGHDAASKLSSTALRQADAGAATA